MSISREKNSKEYIFVRGLYRILFIFPEFSLTISKFFKFPEFPRLSRFVATLNDELLNAMRNDNVKTVYVKHNNENAKMKQFAKEGVYIASQYYKLKVHNLFPRGCNCDEI